MYRGCLIVDGHRYSLDTLGVTWQNELFIFVVKPVPTDLVGLSPIRTSALFFLQGHVVDGGVP